MANVTGEFYPADADTETMLEILGRQIAEPVQFVKGLHTLYEAGARVFVEVGPKKALHGFVEEVLGSEHDDVLALFTNHPKFGDIAVVQPGALRALRLRAGLRPAPRPSTRQPPTVAARRRPLPAAARVRGPRSPPPAATSRPRPAARPPSATTPRIPMSTARYEELGRLFADVLEQGLRVSTAVSPEPSARTARHGRPDAGLDAPRWPSPARPSACPAWTASSTTRTSRASSTASSSSTSSRTRFREAIVDKRITRLVKKAGQDPVFETIDDEAGVIKLAGRGAPLDVVAEFGVEAARDAALDRTTRLAIGAGLDALRDAGIPLVHALPVDDPGHDAARAAGACRSRCATTPA